MKFLLEIANFKDTVDREIEKNLDKYIENIRKKDNIVAEALLYVKKITLAGGKRLRPALVYYSYFGLGGKEKKKIIKVAAAMELVHIYLLIHDDIIDNGKTRHGSVTLHREYAQKAKSFFAGGINEKFGESMAMIMGDLVYSIAIDIIARSGFEAQKIVSAISVLQNTIATTIIGQAQDICIGYQKNVSWEEVMLMYQNKTARYSFEGPLLFGATLAGNCNLGLIKSFSRSSSFLGTAFQIQDDILGIFGDEKKTGKATGEDIQEGKKTLLVMKALENSDSKKRKALRLLLGKRKVSKKEIKEFKDIIKKNGSLEYVRNFANDYIEKAKKEVEKMLISKNSKEMFMGLVEYLENREL